MRDSRSQWFVLHCVIALLGSAWLGMSTSAIAQEPAVELGEPTFKRDDVLKPLAEIRFQNLRRRTDDQVIPELRMVPATVDEPGEHRIKSVQWVNSNLRYRRLYFEEYCLERCGYSPEPCKQPLNSGLRFYSTAVALPILPLFYSPYDCFPHRVE